LFVFYDAQLYALHGRIISKHLGLPKRRVHDMVLPQGESTKSSTHLGQLYDFMLDQNISRDDFILACGGGVTTDLVGYAAATVLRGVQWGAVPTTLLGMVDAAIGGKTAINHKRGKNLIGAFWQPSFVLSDVTLLNTLPPRQMVSGLGEVIKYCGLIGPTMIDTVREYLEASNLYHEQLLVKVIERASAYKADIVSHDEREQDKRMLLNFGHTVGHAIESSLGYTKLLHGETVLLGILAALEVGGQVKPRTVQNLAEYRTMVEGFLRLLPRHELDAKAILAGMAHDKKRSQKAQRFVLLERPGKPFIADDVSNAVLRKAVTRMLAVYSGKKRNYANHSHRKRS
jgi:3-dehydroquinate synthase